MGKNGVVLFFYLFFKFLFTKLVKFLKQKIPSYLNVNAYTAAGGSDESFTISQNCQKYQHFGISSLYLKSP